jgi:uncharacterized protein (DUF885 family)
MGEKETHALSEEYVRRHLEFHPAVAMMAGVHEHDKRLEDFSEASIEAFCSDLEQMLVKARAIDALRLSPEEEVERRILVSKMAATVHEYRVTQTWRSDPSFYAEALSTQLNCILIYDYASAEERARAVAAKERQIPLFLERARQNLSRPAPILVRYGAQGMEGAVKLVRDDLPHAFRQSVSPALRTELERSTAIATAALESFLSWMKNELLVGGEMAYALGADRYAAALAHNEMVETPPSELETWALSAIAEARDGMIESARRIDPNRGVSEVVARMTSDHPPAGSVVETLRKMADDIYDWVARSGLVTIPSPDRVHIDDTPEFMRWSFGSMWTPGPFEKKPMRATFYATDAAPSWPREKQEEHLAAFCFRGLENLTIHEAYPGHFIQALHQNQVDSVLRKTFWWGAFGEGWAHYCEMLAVDEGFGAGAPDVRLVQLQEALNRLCRFVNGIRLHTRPDWSTENGTKFFAENAWMTTAVARAESERGTFDPFYLRYTLGKKMILKLREECRSKLGPKFSLKAFHDALLGVGSAPMPAMAELTKLKLGV